MPALHTGGLRVDSGVARSRMPACWPPFGLSWSRSAVCARDELHHFPHLRGATVPIISRKGAVDGSMDGRFAAFCAAVSFFLSFAFFACQTLERRIFAPLEQIHGHGARLMVECTLYYPFMCRF